MLDKIIHYSISNKVVVGLFTLIIIVAGLYSLNKLPIDAVPDITNNQVQIITSAPSQSALDIERFVTFPIEQTMATIPEIAEIRSFSRFGLSVVTIVFKERTDVYWARQQVNERLHSASEQIPPGIGNPEMAPVTTGLGEIFQYIIRPKKGFEEKYSAMELRTVQDWIVRRQLIGLEGVADVASFGGYLKQYEIALDPDKLRSYDLSIAEILTALENNNQNTGGAYIDKKPNAWFIRSEGLVNSIEDIGKITVKNTPAGMPILIRDVAEVQFGFANRFGAMTYNAEGEVVGAIVLMLKGDNSNAVVNRVKERIVQIEKTLPEGLTIDAFLDRSELVGRTIGTVEKNLIEGALIVIIVLVLFLGNLRAGLIVASVIPLAMLFAVSLMHLFGVSGNLMSLGAIDFGLIVDGAVIIVEATMHHLGMRTLTQRLTQSEMDLEVYHSASKIRTSAAFGEIIILIVYLPILTLVGVEGKMFKPMAQTVSFAILGAFILSLTYVPMMSALFLSKNPEHKRNLSDRMMDFFHRLYQPVILKSLKYKFLVVVTAGILFIGSLFLFLNMGGEFLPTLDEGDFAIETRVLTGSSLSYTIEAAQKGAAVLMRDFPDEVEEVVGKIGSSEIPTDPMPIEACDLMVILKPRDSWTKADDREALAEKMSEALEEVPGVTFGFQQPIQMRFNELMTGVRQDVAVKIFGEDLDILTGLSREIAELVGTVEGARDMYVEEVTGLPQIVIAINRDEMAKYGIDVSTVNQTINTAFAGQSAGLVFEGERRFDLVVRLSSLSRQRIEDVRNLFVTAPNGNQVPLSQLANIEFQIGPNQIQREDAKRRIIVGFNVRGRDVSGVVEELKEKIEQRVKFPPGYYPTYGGQFQNLQEAEARLSIAVPAALILIFILLYLTFGSVRQSALIFTAIPMAAIGGVVALLLRGMPFSISAGVGFIALFGVAVLNGIVLIAEFNRLKKEGLTDVNDIIMKGTAIRLRPVLMTAAVASFGFLPMALATSAGAEVQKPLATVVIGGLISSTLLTLIVLPCLYIYFENIPSRKISPRVIGILILFLLTGASAFGQVPAVPVTLEHAIQQAIQKNKQVEAAQLDVEYNRQLKRTASDIGKTSVMYMRGQYNSYVKNDNNITITQSIPFPTVFSAQSSLGKSRIVGSELQKAATENELIYQVKQVYYQLLYLRAREKLLLRLDSMFAQFANAADLRYRSGESRLLEKSTAEVRKLEAHNQVIQLQADIHIYENHLTTLLNSDQPVTVTDAPLEKRVFNLSTDSLEIGKNPELSYLKQQEVIATHERKVAGAKFLPDIMLGYFNQTLIGTPANAEGDLASTSDRFQGFQVGLSLPLWFGPERAKVKAAELHQQKAAAQYEYQQLSMQGEWQQSIQEYRKNSNAVNYYEASSLQYAGLILKQSLTSFQQGEIGYTEHWLNMNNAIQIEQDYLNSLNNLNQSVIHLEYLAGNKN
ncbi:MAG TPA: CusA/CzcA family heavy metal efflux RND transporter [Ohtaekwangia sp.]